VFDDVANEETQGRRSTAWTVKSWFTLLHVVNDLIGTTSFPKDFENKGSRVLDI